MRIVKQTHWCPSCRITQEEWRILDTEGTHAYKRGDVYESDLPLKVYDKCGSCGREIHGTILLNELDDGVIISTIREDGFRN